MIRIYHTTTVAVAILTVGVLSACRTTYRVGSVERTRIVIDNRYDPLIPTSASSTVDAYRTRIDSITRKVVAHATHNMSEKPPGGELANLTADFMVWAAHVLGDSCEIGIYNMGGIRASLQRGPITVGDALQVLPFANTISCCTLQGSTLMDLFRQMAASGGQAVSKGVRMEIDAHGKLLSATFRGQRIDTTALYRIATIDFLAQGNDKMEALTRHVAYCNIADKRNDTRTLWTAFLQESTDKDGRLLTDTVTRVICHTPITTP
ncbi:MAG: 5'-nucleotidase C-terminal domain-containing protein [Prevotella sp.]